MRRLQAYDGRHTTLTGWIFRIAQEILAGQRRTVSAVIVPGRTVWFAPGAGRLTLLQRSILILRVMQRLSVPETSYALRLSEADVKRGLREALQELQPGRQCLSPSQARILRAAQNDQIALR